MIDCTSPPSPTRPAPLPDCTPPHPLKASTCSYGFPLLCRQAGRSGQNPHVRAFSEDNDELSNVGFDQCSGAGCNRDYRLLKRQSHSGRALIVLLSIDLNILFSVRTNKSSHAEFPPPWVQYDWLSSCAHGLFSVQLDAVWQWDLKLNSEPICSERNMTARMKRVSFSPRSLKVNEPKIYLSLRRC